jgi:colanic acid/amylovoran biosynthesis glycosyltransferase
MDGMACGLVPICLDISGGVRELVIHRETGLLVKDREESFYQAIYQLYSDIALRQKLSEQARIHIEKHYSLGIATDRWEFFCQELIKKSSEHKSINIPYKFKLPPVREGLDREDTRQPSFYQSLYSKTRNIFDKLKYKMIQ